jgi:sortase A
VMGVRSVLAAAVLLLLAGLGEGAATAWDFWAHTRETQVAQRRLSDGWAAGRAGAPARLHLPTLGLDLVVVEGDADADLRLGPGRIAGTAPIGAPGNTGVAGHRYPGVFWTLDRLGIGAPVVLETRETWFVYRVIEALVAAPGETAALAPPPPGAGPLLTLLTSEPRLGHRSAGVCQLIRQATLVRRDPRGGPRPAELT